MAVRGGEGGEEGRQGEEREERKSLYRTGGCGAVCVYLDMIRSFFQVAHHVLFR